MQSQPNQAPVRVLIVGAGAVGKTYGSYLKQGGARVTLYVRQKYQEQMRKPIAMHHYHVAKTVVFGLLSYLGVRKSQDRLLSSYSWKADNVVCAEDGINGDDYDVVLYTVSSDAMQGQWLQDLATVTKQCMHVVLQPASSIRDHMATIVGDNHVATGMITLIAYEAPLEGETTEPGCAELVPPAPVPFWAYDPTNTALQQFLRALDFGGMRTKHAAMSAMPLIDASSMMMMSLLAGWELEDWEWDRFAASPRYAQAMRSAEQLRTVAGHKTSGLIGKAIRWLTPLARRILPFDYDIYMRTHFSKVGQQTREMLAGYVEAAQASGASVPDAAALSADISARPISD